MISKHLINIYIVAAFVIMGGGPSKPEIRYVPQVVHQPVSQGPSYGDMMAMQQRQMEMMREMLSTQASTYQSQIDLLTKKLESANKSGDIKEISKAQQDINEAVIDAVGKTVTAAERDIKNKKKQQSIIRVCVCGRVNSGKSTTINAILKPDPPAVTSAAENTQGINIMSGTTLCDSSVEAYDVQGVSDALFAEHLNSVVTLAAFDCIVFVYTDSIKNVEFLLRTCVATKAPVVCLRNKSDKDDANETEAAINDDIKAVKRWFSNNPPDVIPISAKTKYGIDIASNRIKSIADNNLSKYK